jgi:nitrogen fixation NifU-like protein
MNEGLRELYQEVIIDHNENPHNHYLMEDANAKAQGVNPLCGDKLTVYLKIKHNRIDAISFLGRGCAISQASASLMTEAMQGKTKEEAHQLFEKFHTMLTQETEIIPTSLGKLQVLAGVKAFPVRVKCATLAWHTFEAALNKSVFTVSTE